MNSTVSAGITPGVIACRRNADYKEIVSVLALRGAAITWRGLTLHALRSVSRPAPARCAA
jgi:hypothetical protein